MHKLELVLQSAQYRVNSMWPTGETPSASIHNKVLY